GKERSDGVRFGTHKEDAPAATGSIERVGGGHVGGAGAVIRGHVVVDPGCSQQVGGQRHGAARPPVRADVPDDVDGLAAEVPAGPRGRVAAGRVDPLTYV